MTSPQGSSVSANDVGSMEQHSHVTSSAGWEPCQSEIQRIHKAVALWKLQTHGIKAVIFFQLAGILDFPWLD